jgi:hypothetical protein
LPKPRNVERKVRINVWIPEPLRGRMDLKLYDPIMGKIPFGAHGDLIARAVTDYLDRLETNVQS